MSYALDIGVIVTAVVAVYLGWRLGVLRLVLPVVGAVAGLLIAGRYYQPATAYLPEGLASPDVARIISFAAIALGIFLGAVMLGAVARRMLRVLFLGWVDKTAGLVVGLGLTLSAWSVGLGTIGPYLGGEFTGAVDQSRVAAFLMEEAPRLTGLVPEPVKQYVEGKTSGLEAPWTILLSK